MEELFLRVDPQLWRGPQPTRKDLERLRERGLRAVFNLRQEAHHSRELALAVGLAYHWLPIEDGSVPTREQLAEFFELLELNEFRPALIHCWGGAGRTGVLAGCYRIRQGMEVEAAIALSDTETPQLRMSESQREWLRSYRI